MSSFSVNKPETWGCAEIHTPPVFDVAAYQKKINAIFGLSPTGHEIVRLVWAPDIKKCYSRFYTSWAPDGTGVNDELRAKYRYATIAIPGTANDIIDVPPPRWIIEDREDPGQFAATWEAGRWSQGREIRPPAPTEGYYAELFKIAKHNGTCCKETPRQFVCWGEYREPDEKDLERLKRAKYLRDKDEEFALDAPVPEKVLASAALVTNEKIAQKQLMADEKMKEFVDENALELIEMFTGIKCSEKTRKFSLPKETRIIPSTTL